jgi:putative zinc finger/helix-turn-helix YgiT family protein
MEEEVMKCAECGEAMTVEPNAVLRYKLGGLPHVELHGVELRKCGACGNEDVSIPRIGQLHRVLAEAFVTQHRMLAPAEIRFLRKHLGLSGADFAQRMGVARETVSRWEAGAQPMGAVADRLLRLLVVSHEPSESYAVDDLLQQLDDTPAPDRLASVALWNVKGQGWSAQERPSTELARA